MEFRNKGFYWVKMFDKWQVAGWNGEAWYFTGTEQSAKDDELENIGERVLRPDAEIATLDHNIEKCKHPSWSQSFNGSVNKRHCSICGKYFD